MAVLNPAALGQAAPLGSALLVIDRSLSAYADTLAGIVALLPVPVVVIPPVVEVPSVPVGITPPVIEAGTAAPVGITPPVISA